LAVDQTVGDASIRYGLANTTSFHDMLAAALAENPDCSVWLKVHPEVAAGHKQGHFVLTDLASHPRVRVLGQDVHPVSLIERARAVYVVTSQVGFEGLLWGKRVRTFGMPFYAGWGLTQDQLPTPERRRHLRSSGSADADQTLPATITLEQLVHAALVAYPRYIDPETGVRCEVERLIEWMGLQRRMRERFPVDLAALNFSRWKRPIVCSFFQGSVVRFSRRAEALPVGMTRLVWGRQDAGPDSARDPLDPVRRTARNGSPGGWLSALGGPWGGSDTALVVGPRPPRDLL
jgi:capsular polysaccharide export protein